MTFDAHDPPMLARFWAELLDRSSVGDGHGVLLPGNDTQVGLRFVRSDAERREPAYLHLHLTSSSAADQSDTVAAALRLGARHLDVGQRAEEEHIVLADPEGNAFCVIEPGNAYLTGTGFLGEVACDGSRKVGLFWRDALGWPLVWDQDEETAIQDPRGGTKMAWGGESPDTRAGRNRQQFHLRVANGELEREVERLVAVGADRIRLVSDKSVVLADPDGNAFTVLED